MSTPPPDFSDRNAWDVTADVAVFDEHADRDKGGKVVRKFTREDLEEIARRTNARDARGQPCPLTLGHTRDEAPEPEQPEIVGYARNFRVRYDDRLGRHTIRADYYLRKDRASEARGYPRTSVELWPTDKFFDPIALIRRTPRRDLGQWTYGRSRGATAPPIRYAMGEAPVADRYTPKRFENDDDVDRDGPPARKDPTDAPDAADDGKGDDDFHARCDKYVKMRYPHLDKIHEEYAKKYAAAPGDGNALPDPDKDGLDVDPRDEERGAEKMSRNGNGKSRVRDDDPLRAQKLEVERRKLQQRVVALEKRNRLTERRSTLEKYERNGILLDVEQELADYGDAPDEAWKKHCVRIVNRYEKDPTAGRMVKLEAGDGVPDFGEEMNEAQLDRALKFMRERGCTWNEAYDHARGSKRGN